MSVTYDPSDPPPAGTVNLTTNDTTYFGISVTNSAGNAILASGIQEIILLPGNTIHGNDDAIKFTSTATGSQINTVFNTGGLIWGTTGAGINFSNGGNAQVLNQGTIMGEAGVKMTGNNGRLEVFNSGVISATQTAIQGSSGVDRVVNTGIVRTTTPNGVAIDLGAGNDIYDGSGGSVIGKIVLGEGNDQAYGSSGSETFSGGAGNDTIDGGAGVDTVDYSDAASGSDNSGVTVNLGSTAQQFISSSQGSDTLINIENVVGSGHNDTITGNSGDNSLEGGAGDDRLEGGTGDDTLDGGEGVDTVVYSGSSFVIVDLSLTASQGTGSYGIDVLRNIENVQGGSGADTIKGNAGNNKLEGMNGNDTLDGREGDDTLLGGSGNDTLRGGIGKDRLEGGAGNDIAEFEGTRDDYIVNAAAWTEETEYTVTHKNEDPESTLSGAQGIDTLKGIRVLKFLGADTAGGSDDVLYALTNSAVPTNLSLTMASNSWISGGGVKENAPTDTIVATLAATDADGDTLTYTLQENDLFKLDTDGRTIKVKNGALLNFEALTNGISYAYKLTVTVTDNLKNLSDGAMVGTATRDVYITITNDMTETANLVRYGTNAGEQVVGEYGNDWVYGGAGDDQVFGRAGNDILYGEDGNDYVIGGDGAQGTGLVGTGNDVLYGGNGNDSLFGGDGSDILYGGNGKDVLYGGTGSDIFVFDVKPSTKTNLDHIADFNVAADTIKLSKAVFSKIAKGTLKSGAFVVGTAFKQKDDRILYHKKAGALFYDPDGSGSAKAIQFATISKNLALTHKDFIIF